MSVLIRGGSLRERFQDFVTTLDGFESVDALLAGNDPHGMKRADYLFDGRTIIVEQKILEADPADKPQKFVERLVQDGRVLFYGTLSTDVIFNEMRDGDRLKRQMFDKLTSRLDADLSNADKQTRDTRTIFNIPDAVGVVVILNEGAKTLVPDTIRLGLARTLCKTLPDGSYRYPSNAGVILLSDLHSFNTGDGLRLIPMLQFSHPNQRRVDEFAAFAAMLTARWAAFNGVPIVGATHEQMFTAA